jgi:hypothetical protein
MIDLKAVLDVPFTETPIDDERGSSDSEEVDKLLAEYEQQLTDSYTSLTDP